MIQVKLFPGFVIGYLLLALDAVFGYAFVSCMMEELKGGDLSCIFVIGEVYFLILDLGTIALSFIVWEALLYRYGRFLAARKLVYTFRPTPWQATRWVYKRQ